MSGTMKIVFVFIEDFYTVMAFPLAENTLLLLTIAALHFGKPTTPNYMMKQTCYSFPGYFRKI